MERQKADKGSTHETNSNRDIAMWRKRVRGDRMWRKAGLPFATIAVFRTREMPRREKY